MFGVGAHSDAYETDANPARLESYGGDNAFVLRKKFLADNEPSWYWLASPKSGSTSDFCVVNGYGQAASVRASIASVEPAVNGGYAAPAFCVR
jgi:hypothetical protein